jgi:hypothetical protein
MFANRYRYALILLLAVYTYTNVLFMEVMHYYGLAMPAGWVLALFVVTVGLIWEGNHLVERHLPGLRRRLGGKVHPLVITFALSLPVTLLGVAGPTFVLGRFLHPVPAAQFQLGLKLALVLGFRINLFLNTLNAIFYFLRELRHTQVEAEELKKTSLQAQFQSLKDQVNPHFLFNNLNVLSSLVHKDANQATEFIQQLAKVYRYVLQNQEKELVEVGSELEFMEAYVYLLRTRFHENLHISIDVPVHLLQCYTVPVALQMVVENALKHNISSKNRPLRIEVFAEADRQLVVRNNLQLRPVVEPSTNLGLKNIMRRYGFVSERPVEVVRDDTSFSVKLPLLQEAV